MDKCLVDTDILSEYLRGKNAAVASRAARYLREHGSVTISALTVFEIVRGRYQREQADQAARFLEWSRRAEVLPFDAACAARAGEIAGALLRSGTPLAVADVLIATTAVVHGLVLVTGNQKHFERLRAMGLRLENWRDAPPTGV